MTIATDVDNDEGVFLRQLGGDAVPYVTSLGEAVEKEERRERGG